MKQRLSSQQGSITVFFVLFIFVVLGAVSFSLFNARVVQEKIKLTQSGDLAALAAANAQATGLNVIAVNNLSTAASIHVAAALPILSRVATVLTMLPKPGLQLEAEGGYLQASLFNKSSATSYDNADVGSYGYYFEFARPFAGILIQSAAGNLAHSKLIREWWFYKPSIEGMSAARKNAPGAIYWPNARSNSFATPTIKSEPKFLAVSNPKSTVCHLISSSDGLEHRDSALFWLKAPLQTLGVDIPEDVVNAEATLHRVLASIQGAIDAGVKEVAEIAKTACDALGEFGKTYDHVVDALGAVTKVVKIDAKRLKVNQICEAIEKITEFLGAINQIVPDFQTCGLNGGGNYGEQIEAFVKNVPAAQDEIGFMIFDLATEDTQPVPGSANDPLLQLEDSLRLGGLIGKPLFRKSELPQINSETSPEIKKTECPAAFAFTGPLSQREYCTLMLDGIDGGSAASPLISSATGEAAAASGGIGPTAGDSGKLSSLLSRTQWAVAQAKTEYWPSGDDPTTATTHDQDASQAGEGYNNALQRTKYQMFWPAWRARSDDHSNMLRDVLAKFASQ